MPTVSKSLPLLLLAASTAFAQATTQQLDVVKAEYDASEYSAAYPDGFDVQAQPEALLNVYYGPDTLQLGQAYQATAVANLPGFTLTPGSPSALSTTDKYTLMLADANPLGNAAAQAEGQYRHYLANNVGLTAGQNNTLTFSDTGSTVVTAYAGPGPAQGEGPHRYAWMVFTQPQTFQAPANLTAANTGPGHWYVGPYVQASGLGPLVATAFFTVEAGTATYSVEATSSVNTATVGASSSSSAASSTSAAGGSTAASSASSSAASTTKSSSSSADKLATGVVGFLAAAFAALLA